MKRKEIKELKQKTLLELKVLLAETQMALTKLRMELATAKNKNVRGLAGKRDDIARIKTTIEEKKEAGRK